MDGCHVGFVSTRFAGTDGVSLESAKWAEVFWHNRHTSYWFAGKLDRDPDASYLAPLAYFHHPDIEWINRKVYGLTHRDPEVTLRINSIAKYLRDQLDTFVKKFEIDILCVQNALTIPMNVPLGVALTNYIAETNIPTIAHHHDFYWERDRFRVNAIGDYLGMAFPPNLPSIQHVTINSPAQADLGHRRGLSSILIPNVLDFEDEPDPADEYIVDLRSEIGLEEGDIMFLQPTRVVPRKGIEHAIALVAALKDDRCKLVISHESGDEGDDYLSALRELAEHQGVDMRLADDRLAEKRGRLPDGRKLYTLEDFYAAADFITYPSIYEGFGNALLEAFYYKKPVLVNRYSIFIQDIEPKGFDVVKMNGYLTRDVVEHVRHVITTPEYREQMVRRNYELSREFYSYSVLRRKLQSIIQNFLGHEHVVLGDERRDQEFDVSRHTDEEKRRLAERKRTSSHDPLRAGTPDANGHAVQQATPTPTDAPTTKGSGSR